MVLNEENVAICFIARESQSYKCPTEGMTLDDWLVFVYIVKQLHHSCTDETTLERLCSHLDNVHHLQPTMRETNKQ